MTKKHLRYLDRKLQTVSSTQNDKQSAPKENTDTFTHTDYNDALLKPCQIIIHVPVIVE